MGMTVNMTTDFGQFYMIKKQYLHIYHKVLEGKIIAHQVIILNFYDFIIFFQREPI